MVKYPEGDKFPLQSALKVVPKNFAKASNFPVEKLCGNAFLSTLSL